MAVKVSNQKIVLSPENFSWVLDYFIEALFLTTDSNYEVLKETGGSSWSRVGGFVGIESFSGVQSLSIPCLYPFAVSSKFIDDLRQIKQAGTEVVLSVLDPLVIGEMDELFSVADKIEVFDQRDFHALLISSVNKSKIVIRSYPSLQPETKQAKSVGAGIVFDVALGSTFRQLLIASLYEDTAHSFTVSRLPSLGNNVSSDELDKTFENAIANRGLDNRINLKRSGVTYSDLKQLIKSFSYVIIPGSDNDAMAERRALVALSRSMGAAVVLESQRCPLSIYQGDCLSVEGFSDRAKSISLSKAHVWAKLASNDDQVVELVQPAIVKNLRVLFLMRENVFTQSGGDTVLLKRLVEGLKAKGVEAVVDLNGQENIKDYDLVHLFNFALRDNTEAFARKCVEHGVPYVVTSLYEDWPRFFNQMMGTYQCFEHYLKIGQPQGVWEKLEAEIAKVPPSEYWDNTYTASHAKAILTTGREETNAVSRDYPTAEKIVDIALGSEVADNLDGGKLFTEKYGLSDFVLCVGRLETRKNQLMLLKALEDTDHTLVFAANNFTYQPEYASLCKAFKRKGKTVFLERLTPEELASAYQAARVHALPSWYELPGLVSLEAGFYGARVVASKNGTIEDYLGSDGFYCEPNSYESILKAVNEAFDAPKTNKLRERIAEFTWDKSINSHLDLYQEVLGKTAFKVPKIITASKLISLSGTPSLEAALKVGDTFMAKQEYREALNIYIDIVDLHPSDGRANRSLAVAYLQLNELNHAKSHFKKALAIDQRDIKALIGVGAVEWAEGRRDQAYEIYKQAANLDSSNQAAVLYLVNASYELNRLEELEDVLREYLRIDSENRHIQYCLAGCYFKQDKYSLASAIVERILRVEPEHSDALELKDLIIAKTSTTSAADFEPTNITSIPNALREKIIQYKAEQKYEEIVEELRVNGTLSMVDDEIALIQAESLGCLGRTAEAMVLFEKLKQNKYCLAKVYNGMGALKASMSEWDSAESLFVSALEEDNTLEMPLCGLGMCAEFTGSLEDAWNYYLESVKRNPENVQAITGIIRIGYKLQRLNEVEVTLKEYLELKPVDLYMLYSLAGCLYAQGRTNEAVKELKNILLFEPENEKATELLSEIEAGKTYHTVAPKSE